MKFLIDECLHTSLVGVAEEQGHEAQHVYWRGLGGTKDWNLITVIIDEAFTFVTNNARDFRRLHALEEAHAGLIILLPNVGSARQRELFEAALEELGVDGDLFNQAVEVNFIGDEIELVRLDLALGG